MADINRSKIVDIIKGGSSPISFSPIDPASFRTGLTHTTRETPVLGGTPITRFAKPKGEDGGFKGAFGKLIDVVDLGGAAFRSLTKEQIDFWSQLAKGKNPLEGFFTGGKAGASPVDWWQQTQDHMLMSEVLRETGISEKLGIEPGSKTEMALGFGLDVITDPIVYLTGGWGAVPRVLKGMGMVDDVVKALTKASGLAATPAKAAELTAAAQRVSKSRSILSAGKALDEIGIKSGLTFTIPGTGRLGRHIVERPLSFATGGAVGKAARAQRAKTVPSFILPDTAFDVQKYAPQIADSMKLLKKGESAVVDMLTKGGIPKALHRNIMEAAAFGRRSPVTLPFTLPWSTPLVQAVAPLPGYAFRLASQHKAAKGFDTALNARAPIRTMKLSDNPDDALAGIYMEEVANNAAVKAGTFKRQLLGAPGRPPLGYRMAAKAAGVPEEGAGAMRIVEKAKQFGISGEDLMRASDRPTFVKGVLNPELPDSFRRLGAQGTKFHEELLQWWDDARRLTNEQLAGTPLAGFADDLYAARYLSETGQEVLGGAGRSANRSGLGGTPWQPREYVTPSQYTKMVALHGEEEAAKRFSQTWMGQPLQNVTGPGATGKSVRDQMDDIGRRVLGENEYKQIFSNDFHEVVHRYINDMAQGVDVQNVLRGMENVGLIVKTGAQGAIRMDLASRFRKVAGVMDESGRRTGGTIQKFESKIDASRVGAARVRQVDEAAAGVAGGVIPGVAPTSLPANLAPELGRRVNAAMRSVEGLTSGKATWLPKELQAAIKSLDSLTPLPTEGWARVMEQYSGVADEIGREVMRLRQLVNGVDAAAKQAGTRGYAELQAATRNIKVMESALAQMNGLMARAALNDRTVRAGRQLVKTLETGTIPSSILPEMKAWAKKYSEWVDLDNLTGATAYLHAADDDFLRAVSAQIAAGDLPDLVYIAEKVAVAEAGGLANARLYSEALEEAKAAAEKWQGIAPDLERGLEEARLIAQKDVLTPDELFNQQKYLQSAKEQAMELELEMSRARRSAELGRRISAADNQEDALRVLNQERNMQGFQHAYNEALSNQLTGPWLKGYSAVNMKESADLFAAATLAAAKLNSASAMADWTKGYRSLLNYWKAQAVATPGFVIRNIMGATWINSQILGVEMGQHMKTSAMRRSAMNASIEAVGDTKYLQHLRDTAKARNIVLEQPVAGHLASGSAYLAWKTASSGKPTTLAGVRGVFRKATDRDWRVFNEIERSGIAGGGQAAIEVVEKSALGGAGTWNPFRAHFVPFKAVRSANTDAEFMVRMTAARHVMDHGGDLEKAWKTVRKYHFDYSELTPREAQIKLLIPFWKWQKNILPVLIESVGTRPAAWSKLRQIKGELEYASEAEGVVPDYFMENLGIRLPWRMDGSQLYVLPDLPFKDLNRWMRSDDRPITGLKPLDMATRAFAEAAFPYAKLPIELWAGKQFFADLPLKGRFQNVPPSYANIPGLMPLLGGLGKAEKNRQGEWKMTDSDLYVLDQMMPFMGRLRRLIPGEEKYEKRWMTTFLSTMFGGGLRANTPEERRNQLIRSQRELEDDMKRMIDIEVRNV